MRHTDEAQKTMVSAQDKGCPQLGTDAWSRAARQVRERASFLGLTLDETELAFQSVRDLQATYAGLLRCKPGAPRRIRHLQGEPGAVAGGRSSRPGCREAPTEAGGVSRNDSAVPAWSATGPTSGW